DRRPPCKKGKPTFSHHHILRVDADGTNADEKLLWAPLGDRPLHDLELLDPPVARDLDPTHSRSIVEAGAAFDDARRLRLALDLDGDADGGLDTALNGFCIEELTHPANPLSGLYGRGKTHLIHAVVHAHRALFDREKFR